MKIFNPSRQPAMRVSQHCAFRAWFVLIGPALFTATLALQAAVPLAVRELPYDFHPGDLIQVRLQVTPPPGTTNWMVHERYPDRWDFVSSTNASSTNEFSGELTFGPFNTDTARTLSYEVASIPGFTNSVDFAGEVVFNEATNTVVGTTRLPVRNEWLFVGPQTLEQGTVSGVAYGAGRWAASSYGWVTTLEAGGRLTYPRVPRFHGEGWSRLAYVGGLFFLFGAGDGAQISVSDDGVAWEKTQKEAGDPFNVSDDPLFDPFAQTGGYIQSVTYGNGVYVAVGEHYYSSFESQWAGAIFRSTNGYNWRRVFRLLTPSRHINAIAFANNRFLAVGDRATLLTSTNGMDWEETQPLIGSASTNRNLLGVCHGPSGWIIPASALNSDVSPGTVLRSADGESWSELTGTGSGNNLHWQSFYADGKYWFSGFTDAAYTTVDGATWTPIPSSPALLVGPVSRGTDGADPQYLGAGAPYASLVSSTNGSTWTLSASGVNAVWPRYLSVAAFRNEWVVGSQGEHPSGGRPEPFDRGANTWIPNFSVNGLALNIRDSNAQWRQGNADKSYADMLATTNGLLAAGVDRAQQLFANFMGGTDYVLANAAPLPYLNRLVAQVSYKGLSGAYVGGYEYINASFAKTPEGYDLYAETYVARGFDPSRMRWGHFTSTNGSDWKLRDAGLNHVTNYPGIRGLAWGAGRFVAVSEGNSPGTLPSITPITTSSRIFTSTDGENYTSVDLSTLAPGLAGEGLTSIAYGGGRFVAIGNAGRILSSTNGLDWETVHDTDGHRWNRVRHLEGTWAVVGNAGWLAFSLDGKIWSSRTAGAESDFTDIAHQNGSYMVVGSHAMVLLSLPVTPAMILGETPTKLPGAGMQFNISGHPGKVIDIQTGSDLMSWTSLFRRTNTTGTAVITDPEPEQPRRFYRAVQIP